MMKETQPMNRVTIGGMTFELNPWPASECGKLGPGDRIGVLIPDKLGFYEPVIYETYSGEVLHLGDRYSGWFWASDPEPLTWVDVYPCCWTSELVKGVPVTIQAEGEYHGANRSTVYFLTWAISPLRKKIGCSSLDAAKLEAARTARYLRTRMGIP